MNFKNKKVTVIGAGITGISTAAFLKKRGADVWVTDDNQKSDFSNIAKTFDRDGIKYEFGKHSKNVFKGSELVILSPGVSLDSAVVRLLKKMSIPFTGEIEFAYQYCKTKNIIAITGTNGKTTTSSLIAHILKPKRKVFLCGNIGTPLIKYVDEIKAHDFVVLEISSFQLETINKFRPRVSVLLNVTDDHLDRYRSFTEYEKAKLLIFKNQKKDDYAIVNFENANCKKFSTNAKLLTFSIDNKKASSYYENGKVMYAAGKIKKYVTLELDKYKVQGYQNIENILASFLTAHVLKMNDSYINGRIKSFKPLPHRCEYIGKLNDIHFIDDSKGTNIDSTYKALISCTRPVVLIAGGIDKQGDYDVIKGLVRQKVRCLVLIGRAKNKLYSIFHKITKTVKADTLQDAVIKSFQNANKGDDVLLSPMCSSFDMFRDYKHRGEVFAKAFKDLANKYNKG